MNKAAMIFPGQISPDLELELGPNITFYNAVLDDAVKIALECEKNGVDVIISRAGSAAAIKRAVKVPVVNCEVTHSDLIDVLLGVKREFGSDIREVALVNYANVSYDVNYLEQLTQIRVRQFWFWNDANELKERICEIQQAGIRVVLGQSMTVRFAREMGIKGHLMQVGRETLRQAIQKAKEILEIRRVDLAYAEKIKSMLSFAREGILFVNDNSNIEYANPRAEDMVGQETAVLKGEAVSKIFVDWNTKEDKLCLGQIAKIGDNQIIYNRVPVRVRGERVGDVVTFIEAAQIQNVEEKLRNFLHDKGFAAKHNLLDIVGNSLAIKEAIHKATLFGQTDSTVLIVGETGTGKELFAHGLHNVSLRKQHPFLAINCAALPEGLLESELFGYTEGAFTGAKRGGRAGFFELAHRGTLFLDEIGELRLPLQGKLLRVIQEKEVMRLGGDRIIPVDTRIIAATNRNLLEAVENKEFRSDLYYRLNVLKLQIPSLRARREDIPLLVEHFSRQFSVNNKTPIPAISRDLLLAMDAYEWPGNVRELECLIQRYCLLAGTIRDSAIIEELFNSPSDTVKSKSLTTQCLNIDVATLEEMLDDIYSEVYQMTGENKSKTAQILGVNRMTVAKWLERRQSTDQGL
jgi:PAS domain S-box-containing protein